MITDYMVKKGKLDLYLSSLGSHTWGQSPLKTTATLAQAILALWSKFCDPSLNGWRVMARTSSNWDNIWLNFKFDLTLNIKVKFDWENIKIPAYTPKSTFPHAYGPLHYASCTLVVVVVAALSCIGWI